MGGVLFFNGPVQNGDFTFADRPGKATGIRLAAALNQLLGAAPVPHLWNTATLTGDLRHRAHARSGGTARRAVFEAGLIAAKYDRGQAPAAGTVTDTDPQVAALALEMAEAALRSGALTRSREDIPHCTRCGHMAGTGTGACKACGGTLLRARARTVLVAEHARGRPLLGAADLHAHRKQAPRHLQTIAAHTPHRLVLSRTRDHGISLDPLGLPGLVLDPRAALHATVLAAAARRDAATAVMLLTANAAAHIAAYGQAFLRHDGVRLAYGLHGRIPYDHLPDLDGTYRRYRCTPADRAVFEGWFLPLHSWHAKNDIAPGQLAGLLTHFHRARLAAAREPGAGAPAAHDVQRAIEAGGTDWLTRNPGLAAALALRSRRHTGHPGQN